MKAGLSLVFFLILSITQTVKSQYVDIPDPNFLQVLQASPYTASLIAHGDLDTTLAANLDNSNLWALYWFNAGITDITGLQYFKKITILNIGGNKLKGLPPLPESVTMLDCSKNQLLSLPKLPDHLKSIMCLENQLPNLPDLPESIESVLCQNNEITTLPLLPDSLYYLNCGNNQLSSLPVLPNILKYLYCYSNQLNNLPLLSDSLTYLNCDGNNLTTLPPLPSKIETVFCQNNKLTFEDIVPNINIPSITYSPQDSVDNAIHLASNKGDTLEFKTTATYTGNIYQWVKNNILLKDSANITGSTTPNLTLKNITPSDTGSYSCIITNPDAPLLTLNRRNIRLDIITPKEPLPEITIYELLSPNRDNENDYWEIQNLEKFNNIEVAISNTWGEIVFHREHYFNDWNGDNLKDGTYYYKVKVHDTNKSYKGKLIIKR